MANYLPIYLNMEKRPILIFGGAGNAVEIIKQLLPYGAELNIAAEKVTPSIKGLAEEKKLRLIKSNGSDAQRLISRIEPVFVIIADADPVIIADIFKACVKKGVAVNTVGKPDFSTFLFPSVIQRKNLSVAVSTFGISPAAAKWIRDHIEKSLPTAIDHILEQFHTIHQKIKAKASAATGQFTTIYREILNAALRENRMLSAGEVTQIMTKHIEEAE
jgi:siroheme synthase-like protein